MDSPQHVSTAAEPLTRSQTGEMRPRRAATGETTRRHSTRSGQQSFGPLERVRTTLLSQMTPAKPIAPAPSAWRSSLSILRSSRAFSFSPPPNANTHHLAALNILLLFIPVSVCNDSLLSQTLIDIFSYVKWALHFALAGKQDTLIFVCTPPISSSNPSLILE